jgi:hypothetical protein
MTRLFGVKNMVKEQPVYVGSEHDIAKEKILIEANQNC